MRLAGRQWLRRCLYFVQYAYIVSISIAQIEGILPTPKT